MFKLNTKKVNNTNMYIQNYKDYLKIAEFFYKIEIKKSVVLFKNILIENVISIIINQKKII